MTLTKQIRHLQKQLGERHSFDKIIGNSAPIKQAIALAKRVADGNTTVLLTGETGTGKELFAQAIHQESSRRRENFVAINCSAFSKELLESEMFGHRTGAFTGAVKDQKGLFAEADKGTIFLDEMGEMALDLQAKLLRVIETGEFIRVGESKPTKTDVRIVAATNRDLQQEIDKGLFREDLFYRISAFQIHLPPLRERLSDIEVLANLFIHTFVMKTTKRITGAAPIYIEALKKHPWKGNVRELKNVIERSIILCDEEQLQIDTLPIIMQKGGVPEKGKQLSAFDLSSVEKLHIQKVMNYTMGNKTKTAELLGIALTTLYRKLAEYNID